MPRNPRPAWRGIGGRHAAELTADIGRNTQTTGFLGDGANRRRRVWAANLWYHSLPGNA